MSLSDIATLLDLSEANCEGLGSIRMLDDYHKARMPDIKLKIRGIDALNRASQLGLPVAQSIRATGLKALHQLTPVRKKLMQIGVGGG